MKTTVINKTVVSPEYDRPYSKIMIHENDLNRPDPLIVKFVYDEDDYLKYGITLASNLGATYQDTTIWSDHDEFVSFTGTITIEV